MMEFQDIADRVVSIGLPTLLVDTCSVLDVVRCPMRMKQAEIKAALRIVDTATSTPPQCYMVRSSLIEKEFQDHIDGTKAELEKELRSLSASIACLDAAADYFSIVRMGVEPASELADCLEQTARRIIAKCHPIDGYVDARERAHDRVIKPIAPARPGKQSYKDCLIFEEYLELTKRVIASGSKQSVVFLTSNTEDYKIKGDNKIHPDIASAAEAIGLKVCFTWQEAAYELLGAPSK